MAGKEKVKFGIFILQENMAWNELRDKVVMADRLGFHSFWFGDHLWAPVNHQTPFFEGWTLVSALAACTEGIRLGLMVTCNSLRHPALLAKMASSLDVISNGRVALAIGVAPWRKSTEFSASPSRSFQSALGNWKKPFRS